MNVYELIYYFGTVCAIAGAIMAWMFVIVYARRRWFEFEMGQNAMLFTAVVAMALSWISYRAIEVSEFLAVPPINNRDNIARTLIFFGISVALFHRLYIIFKAGRKRPRNGAKPSYFTEQIRNEENKK